MLWCSAEGGEFVSFALLPSSSSSSSLSRHLLLLFLPSSGECCNWYATGNKSAQLQGWAVTIIWTDRFSCFGEEGERGRVDPAQLTRVINSSPLHLPLEILHNIHENTPPPPSLLRIHATVKPNKQIEVNLWQDPFFLSFFLSVMSSTSLSTTHSNSYVHRDAVQSCQLIGRSDIRSNQLSPLQPLFSNAFSWCDNGLGSPDMVAAHSQSHRHTPAQNDWHVFPWWCQIWLATLFQCSSHHFT